MTAGLPSHIEWYETGRLAPYLRERRLAGSAGTLLEVAQPAGDMSDPPTSDLLLIRTVSPDIRQRSNLGGGRFSGTNEAGTLFVVPPATATDIEVHVPHVVRGHAFPAALLRPQLEAARPNGDPFDFGPLHAGGFRDAHLLGLLDRMWDEAGRGDAAGRLYADGAMVAMLGILLRLAERPDRSARGGLAPWQLSRVQGLIEARLAEEVSLAELAALVGLSPWHLCRAFRQSTGMPPHRWQVARRVERAKQMLETTALPVTAIAAAVGYDDPGQLSVAFRKAVGVTPSRWRRERVA